jgi:maltooligosyltrehalose trehalohydrolase
MPSHLVESSETSTSPVFAPGARVEHDGVHYSVWAPLHREMTVDIRRFGGGAERLTMVKDEKGYFTVQDIRGKAGDRYSYILPDGVATPDPASRFQPEGVHGFSECVDPRTFEWRARDWKRPGWRGQSIYEIHLGTFTKEGTFAAAIDRLDHVVQLGVDAIEIMPVADFPGQRNWGYDGVALFAPARCYGSPDSFRALVDAAHERGLAVILDVVYNHLGPDGNYLSRFSNGYFHPDRHTPWGQAFHLSGPGSEPVRNFFLSNVGYWLDEFRIDGLRLDATHAIEDDSPRHLLAEMADIAHGRGAFLIAEDERNSCDILGRPDGSGAGIDAAWADDFHHEVRVALTGVQESYFKSYRGTAEELAHTLRHGWFFTGQPYPFWKGRPKGEESSHLPAKAFVYCIENHDQVGNRALGERLENLIEPAAFKAASALLCLSPYPPLIFMGQEWAASTPFLYFTDHAGELGKLVSEGRRKEFSAAGLNEGLAPEQIPDPQAASTFEDSKLKWDEAGIAPHSTMLTVYQECLRERRWWIHGDALARSNWRVAAIGETVAIRYERAGPLRVVVSCLKPGARIEIAAEEFLELPANHSWSVELETATVCFDQTNAPCSGGSDRDVRSLVFNQPATVLLIAIASGTEGSP